MNLRQPFGEVSAAAFDLHMALHLRAPFLLTQVTGAGHGGARLRPHPQHRLAAELARLSRQRALRRGEGRRGAAHPRHREEWSPRGVTCNAIAPGFFPTPLTAPVFADRERAAKNAAQTAIGRNGELDDLHGATVFLASAASSYVTGQTLAVDGGFTAK